MARSFLLLARRTAQTPRIARNFPQVYAELLTGRLGGATRPLTFRLRNGLTVTTPNVPGARVPIYELFSEDSYRMGEVVSGLPDGFVALDIGAQVGCFSLALSTARPDARIFAFEASGHTADWLRNNVKQNDLGGRITVEHAAVWSERGTLEFLDNASASGLNGLTAPAGSTTTQVPSVTFADAVATAGGRVDLVKLDTEGAEYEIVLGSSPEDWATVSRVVMEYHKVSGHDWAELQAFFEKAGLHKVREESTVAGWGAVWLERA